MMEILAALLQWTSMLVLDAEGLAVSSLFSRASLKTVPDISWFNFIFLQR